MDFDRMYQVPGEIKSGMFCRLCGRPTVLETGLCPTCCQMKYYNKTTGPPELKYDALE